MDAFYNMFKRQIRIMNEYIRNTTDFDTLCDTLQSNDKFMLGIDTLRSLYTENKTRFDAELKDKYSDTSVERLQYIGVIDSNMRKRFEYMQVKDLMELSQFTLEDIKAFTKEGKQTLKLFSTNSLIKLLEIMVSLNIGLKDHTVADIEHLLSVYKTLN